MRKTVSVFIDIEDPINTLADDALLDLLNVFDETAIRGSLCITGEKCRSLKARKRSDIVDKMLPHCLGLHSDTHSYHPTTMELLANLPYEEGCRAAYGAEYKGVSSFRELFGSYPAFWGGAAFTWSPEINHALRELEIPSYSYSLTAIPNRGIHRFDGAVAFPHGTMVHEVEWADDEKADKACTDLLALIHETPQPWLGVLVGHPTKFRHKDYWDTPYFGGRTPNEPEYMEPVPDEVFDRSKVNLRKGLRLLRQEFEVKGLDEVLEWPWNFRRPTTEELDYFEMETADNIRSASQWCVHRPNLDPELIVSKTLALKDTLEIAYL